METVRYQGKDVGTLDWQRRGSGAQVTVTCEVSDAQGFLRCWAKTETGWFLIGLLSPEGGRLVLQRTLSGETCKQMGAAEQPPSTFVLGETQPEDEVVQAVAQAPVPMPEPEMPVPEPEMPAPDLPAPQVPTPKDPAPDIPAPELPTPNAPDPNQTAPELPVPQPREMPPMPGSEVMAQAEQPLESAKARPAPLPHTGDALLDSMLADGALEISCTEEADAIVCTCEFAKDKAFALAPLFGLCTIEHGKAVLRWNKQGAEQ